MSKAAEMAKVSARGSFHFLWGLVISTCISAVATIFVGRLLGSDLYGLYGIILIAPTLMGTFRDWGVNAAIIRFTAQFRAENRLSEIRNIAISGMVFEITLGIFLSAVLFGVAGFLATTVFSRPEITELIQLASISILADGIVKAASSVFTGMEKMELYSVVLIAQSAIRTAIMVTLIILGFGTYGAVLGYTISVVIAGLVSASLVWLASRNLPKLGGFKIEVGAYVKTMLQYGIPLSLSSIINSFLFRYYMFLLPIFYVADNIAIGNYSMASNFIVLIGFFATPITTMLFPAFSKLSPQKDKQTLKKVYQYSIKYASLIVVPIAALVMCLAQPAVATLFGETYTSAALFLPLLAVAYIFPVFGSLSMGSFISSQGKNTFLLYLTLIETAIGVPLGYVLIMQLGVLGLIITTLAAGIPNMIISLYWIKKHYDLTVEWASSAKVLLSSVISAASTYTLISLIPLSNIAKLALGTIFFAMILVTTILLTKTVTKTDIENFRNMLNGLGFIGIILNLVLNIVDKLAKKT